MFRSKSLLCLRKAAVVGTKFVEKSSNTSWTKIFNTENKYLFGDLLESQGNRKKRLTLQKVTSENFVSSHLGSRILVKNYREINYLNASSCHASSMDSPMNNVIKCSCEVDNVGKKYTSSLLRTCSYESLAWYRVESSDEFSAHAKEVRLCKNRTGVDHNVSYLDFVKGDNSRLSDNRCNQHKKSKLNSCKSVIFSDFFLCCTKRPQSTRLFHTSGALLKKDSHSCSNPISNDNNIQSDTIDKSPNKNIKKDCSKLEECLFNDDQNPNSDRTFNHLPGNIDRFNNNKAKHTQSFEKSEFLDKCSCCGNNCSCCDKNCSCYDAYVNLYDCNWEQMKDEFECLIHCKNKPFNLKNNMNIVKNYSQDSSYCNQNKNMGGKNFIDEKFIIKNIYDKNKLDKDDIVGTLITNTLKNQTSLPLSVGIQKKYCKLLTNIKSKNKRKVNGKNKNFLFIILFFQKLQKNDWAKLNYYKKKILLVKSISKRNKGVKIDNVQFITDPKMKNFYKNSKENFNDCKNVEILKKSRVNRRTLDKFDKMVFDNTANEINKTSQFISYNKNSNNCGTKIEREDKIKKEAYFVINTEDSIKTINNFENSDETLFFKDKINNNHNHNNSHKRKPFKFKHDILNNVPKKLINSITAFKDNSNHNNLQISECRDKHYLLHSSKIIPLNVGNVNEKLHVGVTLIKKPKSSKRNKYPFVDCNNYSYRMLGNKKDVTYYKKIGLEKDKPFIKIQRNFNSYNYFKPGNIDVKRYKKNKQKSIHPFNHDEKNLSGVTKRSFIPGDRKPNEVIERLTCERNAFLTRYNKIDWQYNDNGLILCDDVINNKMPENISVYSFNDTGDKKEINDQGSIFNKFGNCHNKFPFKKLLLPVNSSALKNSSDLKYLLKPKESIIKPNKQVKSNKTYLNNFLKNCGFKKKNHHSQIIIQRKCFNKCTAKHHSNINKKDIFIAFNSVFHKPEKSISARQLNTNKTKSFNPVKRDISKKNKRRVGKNNSYNSFVIEKSLSPPFVSYQNYRQKKHLSLDIKKINRYPYSNHILKNKEIKVFNNNVSHLAFRRADSLPVVSTSDYRNHLKSIKNNKLPFIQKININPKHFMLSKDGSDSSNFLAPTSVKLYSTNEKLNFIYSLKDAYNLCAMNNVDIKTSSMSKTGLRSCNKSRDLKSDNSVTFIKKPSNYLDISNTNVLPRSSSCMSEQFIKNKTSTLFSKHFPNDKEVNVSNYKKNDLVSPKDMRVIFNRNISAISNNIEDTVKDNLPNKNLKTISQMEFDKKESLSMIKRQNEASVRNKKPVTKFKTVLSDSHASSNNLVLSVTRPRSVDESRYNHELSFVDVSSENMNFDKEKLRKYFLHMSSDENKNFGSVSLPNNKFNDTILRKSYTPVFKKVHENKLKTNKKHLLKCGESDKTLLDKNASKLSSSKNFVATKETSIDYQSIKPCFSKPSNRNYMNMNNNTNSERNKYCLEAEKEYHSLKSKSSKSEKNIIFWINQMADKFLSFYVNSLKEKKVNGVNEDVNCNSENKLNKHLFEKNSEEGSETKCIKVFDVYKNDGFNSVNNKTVRPTVSEKTSKQISIYNNLKTSDYLIGCRTAENKQHDIPLQKCGEETDTGVKGGEVRTENKVSSFSDLKGDLLSENNCLETFDDSFSNQKDKQITQFYKNILPVVSKKLNNLDKLEHSSASSDNKFIKKNNLKYDKNFDASEDECLSNEFIDEDINEKYELDWGKKSLFHYPNINNNIAICNQKTELIDAPKMNDKRNVFNHFQQRTEEKNMCDCNSGFVKNVSNKEIENVKNHNVKNYEANTLVNDEISLLEKCYAVDLLFSGKILNERKKSLNVEEHSDFIEAHSSTESDVQLSILQKEESKNVVESDVSKLSSFSPNNTFNEKGEYKFPSNENEYSFKRGNREFSEQQKSLDIITSLKNKENLTSDSTSNMNICYSSNHKESIYKKCKHEFQLKRKKECKLKENNKEISQLKNSTDFGSLRKIDKLNESFIHDKGDACYSIINLKEKFDKDERLLKLNSKESSTLSKSVTYKPLKNSDKVKDKTHTSNDIDYSSSNHEESVNKNQSKNVIEILDQLSAFSKSNFMNVTKCSFKNKHKDKSLTTLFCNNKYIGDSVSSVHKNTQDDLNHSESMCDVIISISKQPKETTNVNQDYKLGKANEEKNANNMYCNCSNIKTLKDMKNSEGSKLKIFVDCNDKKKGKSVSENSHSFEENKIITENDIPKTRRLCNLGIPENNENMKFNFKDFSENAFVVKKSDLWNSLDFTDYDKSKLCNFESEKNIYTNAKTSQIMIHKEKNNCSNNIKKINIEYNNDNKLHITSENPIKSSNLNVCYKPIINEKLNGSKKAICIVENDNDYTSHTTLKEIGIKHTDMNITNVSESVSKFKESSGKSIEIKECNGNDYRLRNEILKNNLINMKETDNKYYNMNKSCKIKSGIRKFSDSECLSDESDLPKNSPANFRTKRDINHSKELISRVRNKNVLQSVNLSAKTEQFKKKKISYLKSDVTKSIGKTCASETHLLKSDNAMKLECSEHNNYYCPKIIQSSSSSSNSNNNKNNNNSNNNNNNTNRWNNVDLHSSKLNNTLSVKTCLYFKKALNNDRNEVLKKEKSNKKPVIALPLTDAVSTSDLDKADDSTGIYLCKNNDNIKFNKVKCDKADSSLFSSQSKEILYNKEEIVLRKIDCLLQALDDFRALLKNSVFNYNDDNQIICMTTKKTKDISKKNNDNNICEEFSEQPNLKNEKISISDNKNSEILCGNFSQTFENLKEPFDSRNKENYSSNINKSKNYADAISVTVQISGESLGRKPMTLSRTYELLDEKQSNPVELPGGSDLLKTKTVVEENDNLSYSGNIEHQNLEYCPLSIASKLFSKKLSNSVDFTVENDISTSEKNMISRYNIEEDEKKHVNKEAIEQLRHFFFKFSSSDSDICKRKVHGSSICDNMISDLDTLTVCKNLKKYFIKFQKIKNSSIYKISRRNNLKNSIILKSRLKRINNIFYRNDFTSRRDSKKFSGLMNVIIKKEFKNSEAHAVIDCIDLKMSNAYIRESDKYCNWFRADCENKLIKNLKKFAIKKYKETDDLKSILLDEIKKIPVKLNFGPVSLSLSCEEAKSGPEIPVNSLKISFDEGIDMVTNVKNEEKNNSLSTEKEETDDYYVNNDFENKGEGFEKLLMYSGELDSFDENTDISQDINLEIGKIKNLVKYPMKLGRTLEFINIIKTKKKDELSKPNKNMQMARNFSSYALNMDDCNKLFKNSEKLDSSEHVVFGKMKSLAENTFSLPSSLSKHTFCAQKTNKIKSKIPRLIPWADQKFSGNPEICNHHCFITFTHPLSATKNHKRKSKIPQPIHWTYQNPSRNPLHSKILANICVSESNINKICTRDFQTRESAVKFQTVQKVHYEKQKPSKIVSSEPINNDAVIGKKEESDKKYSFNLTVPLGKVTEFPLINNTKVKLKYKLPKNGALSFDYSINYDNEVLKNIPSVSRILKATMPEKSKLLLENWQKKMIAELGVEGFESMNKAKLKQGSDLHEYIRKYLLNGKSSKEFDTAPVNIITILKSLKSVFKKLSDVCVLESHVIHSELPYRGIIDCVAKYNGKLAVIEWKHSDKRKPYIQWTYDAPIQLSAYLGALNYDNNYRIPVKAGMVVVAYTDGSPADVFWLTNQACERYWKSWLSRLFEFISTHANQ